MANSPRQDESQNENSSGASIHSDSGSQPQEPGDRMLGEFRLLRKLGRGGMAEVYLAEQTSLRRNVAIKILRQDVLDDTDSVLLKRFEQEALAAAGLTHPNIVQVHSVGQQDKIHFIAQEYVRGVNLHEYLTKNGPPDVPVALHIMKQVAAALQAASDAGVVHRDIKPDNIMVNRKGEVKVADFGLAQLTQEGRKVNLTQEGTTMGTPLYMSPEQVHGRKIDHRSDIYSFGVTCYHLLSGEPPFRGETAMSVAIQHVNEDPPLLSQRRPDLPPALCAIVQKMMAKQPEKRYPDAESLLKDLRKLSRVIKDERGTQMISMDHFVTGEKDDEKAHASLIDRLKSLGRVQHVALLSVVCLVIFGLTAAVGWLARPGDPLKDALRNSEASNGPVRSSPEAGS